ncbi:MAG: 50S ribosomal protein L19 [candidate division Zixibacteria bacterium RBG_16_50_21]|nr:MAG: 50S ribosomal protein L19 [candidate division Zixibacteria bacterium RBG_16_50_21]
MDLIAASEAKHAKTKLPEFSPGDTVKVYNRIKEGDKERIQVFEGVVVQKKGTGIGAAVTVRKISQGIGVEKVIPLHSPVLTRLELVKKGKVKRAKLYYLRGLKGRSARIEEKREELERENPEVQKTQEAVKSQ